MSDNIVYGGEANAESKRLTAVVLAAGFSSRMKSFKPLLPVGGVPAVEKLISVIRQAGIDDIVVVTGFGREKLESELQRLGAREAFNADYDKGMFYSIKTGIGKAMQLNGGCAGFLLFPVDCPLIAADTVRAVTEAAKNGETEMNAEFCVPTFNGKKGHPLYVPAAYAEEICSYDGDGGLKGVTDRYRDRMVKIPVDDEGCLMDMDTPEGYEELLEFQENGCRSEAIAEMAKGRRLFLVRHGQTCQHEEKMFIGQYDVPLNDEGRAQMLCTAEKLAGYDPHIGTVYCSDLVRAKESAEIINGALCGDSAHIDERKGLREISLGSWDGMPVRAVKEAFPEEYRMRGEDMFAFKIGNGSENFFDLQYRAVKELRRILRKDGSRDILIVTHSGVIRAIENSLEGHLVDHEWSTLPKGGFRVII